MSKCSKCLTTKGPQQRGVAGAKAIAIIVVVEDETL